MKPPRGPRAAKKTGGRGTSSARAARSSETAGISLNGQHAPGVSRPDPIRPTDRRELRIFAGDPTLGAALGTYRMSEVIAKVRWEPLEPGPIGESIAVIDFDGVTRNIHTPVDLERSEIIATCGLRPDEADPRSHQQMVYAVISKTMEVFEEALGRPVNWRPLVPREPGFQREGRTVDRLHVFPHALTEANACYDPVTRSLQFGCYPSIDEHDSDPALPGSTVFTCLSHDIVVHETVHAILDGVHPRYSEATNVDVAAFHEGFADLVALFMKMDFTDLVEHAIRRSRGSLSTDTLLSQLAVQFGESIGQRGPLRSAIGRFNEETGLWEDRTPDPAELQRTTECHDRGAILVAAVFDAFVRIFQKQSQPLFDIAGLDPADVRPSQLTPPLVRALAAEVQTAARTILNICIRALDYCPPVDICFGDYLRAMITADYEAVRDDRREYRVALIESFRARGIHPSGRRILSEKGLLWQRPACRRAGSDAGLLDRVLGRPVAQAAQRIQLKASDPGDEQWSARTERDVILSVSRRLAGIAHQILEYWANNASPEALEDVLDMTGLDLADGRTFEVHSARPLRRRTPSGRVLNDLVLEITQWADLFDEGYPPGVKPRSKLPSTAVKLPVPFRGGCTLLIDAVTGQVRYCVYKRINSVRRYDAQRRFVLGEEESEMNCSFGTWMKRGTGAAFFRSLHAGPSDSADLYRPGEESDA